MALVTAEEMAAECNSLVDEMVANIVDCFDRGSGRGSTGEILQLPMKAPELPGNDPDLYTWSKLDAYIRQTLNLGKNSKFKLITKVKLGTQSY